MRTRIRSLLLATALFVGLAATACGSSEDVGSSDDSGSMSPASVSDTPDEGQAIEIIPQLVKQGFSKDQISAIAPNSAFWLMPFDTPFRMSQNPDQPTCIFRMTNTSYKESGAIANHPILSNSTVALRVRFVNADGSMSDFRGEMVNMPLDKVTPKELATNGAFQLEDCGNTQLS